MAIITRRYVHVGPLTNALDQIPATINASYGRAIKDIDVDDNPDRVVTLDEFMESEGFAFSATISPSQIFRYTAVGGEANPLIVDAALGFLGRVTAAYNVQITPSFPLGSAIKSATLVEGSQTATQFQVQLGVALEAGDVLQFTVEDR